MSFLLAHKGMSHVAITTVCKRSDGSLVSPDADPLCEIFRTDPDTGSMVKDLDMGTLGEIDLTLVPGSSFLYSGALNIEAATFHQYVCTITYSYDAGADTIVDSYTLVVSDPDSIIWDNRNITVGSQGTTFKAPSPD
tara:strand:- start:95347 stop:95757 length:411 start_codon:yes stop_codon:yes gene_type:complete